MYCPVCGQQQVSDATRFCSRCGFSLSAVAEVVANNGVVAHFSSASELKNQSPRKRGIKQGAFLMLFVLLVPVIALLHEALGIPDIVIALFAVAPPILGLLRIIYALMFESGTHVSNEFASQQFKQNSIAAKQNFANTALPPQPINFVSTPNAAYVPPASQQVPVKNNWRSIDTGELTMPPSVTEDTTKLLDKQ